MDALAYYNQLVLNFPQERRLIADYSKLVAPNHNEMHALSWSDRDKLEDIEASRREVQQLEEVAGKLKAEYEQLQHDITNAKISQTMRRSQIARLSGLSQPVEFDQTYFFADRHPPSSTSGSITLHNNNSSSVESEPMQKSIGMGSTKGAQGIMRTGDTVILESRLDDVSRIIQGQFHLFSTKLSSINLSDVPESSGCTSPKKSINVITAAAAVSSTKRANLRKEATEILNQLEKKEEQLHATIVELLNLRLRMMIAQREEVEDREVLKNEKTEYERKEAEALSNMKSQLVHNKAQYEKELAHQLNKYKRQLQKSTKKLSALETFDQSKATEKKDLKLMQKLESAKVRYERLCERHELELEGYANEAKTLKNKLKYAQRALKLLT